MLEAIELLPLEYLLALFVLVALGAEATANIRRAWAIPTIAIYATTAAWYFLEPIYTPTAFMRLPQSHMQSAYLQVALFLVSFRIFQPILLKRLAPQAGQPAPPVVRRMRVDKALPYLCLVWFVLFAVGVFRLDGDVLGALLPLQARAGVQMWGRSAGSGAGDFGFLVSTAGYVHLLTSAAFGMLLPFATSTKQRAALFLMIGLSWPAFFLSGSRNTAIAVMVPGFASYLLFYRHRVTTKAIVSLLAFVAVETSFRAILLVRNSGWDALFSGEISISQGTHEGLNMASELVHVNQLLHDGQLSLLYGLGYVFEAANAIPRFLWPDKPLIGIDYAMARGFGSDDIDIGVFATISTGFIGQGVRNFGPIFGPVAPALLFAFWAGLLTRLRQQNTLLRLLLFLMGLGLTFNLGRDITLLVLWPFVFGFLAVKYAEGSLLQIMRPRRPSPHQARQSYDRRRR